MDEDPLLELVGPPLQQADLSFQGGDLDGALAAAERAAEVAWAAGGRLNGSGAASGLAVLGQVFVLLARYRGALGLADGHRAALAEAEQVLGALRARGEPAAAAAAELAEHMGEAREALAGDALTSRMIRAGAVAWKQGRWSEALALAEQALGRARTSGDRRGEADAALKVGSFRHETGGDPHAALSSLERARDLAKRFGADETYRYAELWLCEVLARLERYQEAGECGERALAAARAAGDDVAAAAASNALGNVARHQGRLHEAVNRYRDAMVLSRAISDAQGEADALHNFAGVANAVSASGVAVEALQRASAIRAKGADRLGEAEDEHQSALALRTQGRHQEALERLERAARLSAGSARHEGMVANARGFVYRSLGLLDESLEQLLLAWDIVRTLEDQHAIGAVANNLGLTHIERGDKAAAVRWLRIAEGVARRLGFPEARLPALNNLATVLLLQGHHRRAEQTALEALDLARSLQIAGGEITARSTLGKLALGQGRIDEATSQLREGLALTEALGLAAALPVLLHLLAVAHGRAGRPEEAIDCYARALDQVETLREGLVGDEARAGFLSVRSDLPHDFAVYLASRGRGEQAFEVLERGKARTLLDLLTKRRQPGGGGPGTATAADAAVAVGADDSFGVPRRFDEIRSRLLGPGTALLSYSLGERESLLVAVTAGQVETYELPPRDRIEAMAAGFVAAIAAGEDVHLRGHELYDALIAPAADLIGGRDLLVVPDGVLYHIPFALLATEPPDQLERGADVPYLIRRCAISSAPSASVALLVAERAAARPAPVGQLAAYGDPVIAGGSGQWARLPGSALEVRSLAALFAPAAVPQEAKPDPSSEVRVRLGVHATKADLQALLCSGAGYRFLHLATHGTYDARRPLNSGLILSSGSDAEGESVWWAEEVLAADIRSDLVVLSACESGLGGLQRGEGVTGLVSAFLKAGASSVAASLWRVADAPTAPLMRLFYQGVLGGLSKPQALRAAQLTIIAGPERNGYHWAPFVLVCGLDLVRPDPAAGTVTKGTE